jgi:Ca2+/H+ antiporter
VVGNYLFLTGHAREVVAVMIALSVLSLSSQDGETHGMEGVMLLAVYAMLALSFYHLPGPAH